MSEGAHVHSLVVTATRGLVDLVTAELEQLGARSVRSSPAGLRVRGPLAFAYRVCLWSRCASRVILHLRDAVLASVDDLYDLAREIPWEEHLAPSGTLVVDVSAHGEIVTHSRFAAQRVKDAVVDRMRDGFGTRPSVAAQRPDVRIAVHVRGRGCSIGIDLSGEPLHRRGWRVEQGPAPVKETLAAALLVRGGWPELAAAGAPLVDPLCGAGTVVIESAGMAGDLAPGRARPHFGFVRWRGHDRQAWAELLAEADARARAGAERPWPEIVGVDVDGEAIERARRNAARAGVADRIRFERTALAENWSIPPGAGLVATNPPYGARLGDEAATAALYDGLGTVLRERLVGWRASVLVAEDAPLARLGLPLQDAAVVDNGPIPCRMIRAELGGTTQTIELGEEATMFANRLRKNLRRLHPWAARHGVTCYRLYDADIPEFNAAIDRYEDAVHVQEYRAPRSVDPHVAAARMHEIVRAVAAVLEIPPSAIVVKRRRPQRPGQQYTRFAKTGRTRMVREGSLRFEVNLEDYLDTGLFLDHRPLRRMLGELAANRRVLNLFCYTGSLSVAAAAGGATTTSVDLSNTYLDWARRNFGANGIDESKHRFFRGDCREFLADDRGRYDIIVIDPPTHSASKSSESSFDVQHDHVALLRAALAHLAPEGVIFFSTNRSDFALDVAGLPGVVITDLTATSLDPDFRREPPIHRLWRIERAIHSSGPS